MKATASKPSSSNVMQVKITANSAEEAVKLIQHRFGDKAKVIDVRNQESAGLKRYFSKPRLAVVVEVPRQAAQAHAVPKEAAQELESVDMPQASSGKAPVSKLYAQNASAEKKDGAVEKQISKKPAAEPSYSATASPENIDASKRIVSMLEAVGFDNILIERIRQEVDLPKSGSLPPSELYSLVCAWLRSQFPDTKNLSRGKSRAFIGTNGSGKTTAVCKALASDVFVNGLEPMVMKIDSDVPNAVDGLEAFCSIVDRPLLRSPEEMESIPSLETPLYVDMPGLNLSDDAKVEQCRLALDGMEIEERILVVNAAYDAEMIGRAYEAGRRIGATRVVYTHLDETFRVGKLWKFFLNSDISPLFFSHGANPAGDYSLEPFSYLLERTFPQSGSLVFPNKSLASDLGQAKAPAKEAASRS